MALPAERTQVLETTPTPAFRDRDAVVHLPETPREALQVWGELELPAPSAEGRVGVWGQSIAPPAAVGPIRGPLGLSA